MNEVAWAKERPFIAVVHRASAVLIYGKTQYICEAIDKESADWIVAALNAENPDHIATSVGPEFYQVESHKTYEVKGAENPGTQPAQVVTEHGERLWKQGDKPNQIIMQDGKTICIDPAMGEELRTMGFARRLMRW